MGTFVAYTFVTGIILLTLYAVYKLLLERETFHRFNRIFVLSSYVVSWAAGIIYVTAQRPQEISLPAMNIIYNSSYVVTTPTTIDHTAYVSHVLTEWAIMAAIVLYAAGLLFFIAREGFIWYHMCRIIRSGIHSYTTSGRQLVIHNDSKIAPFSWYRYIVMSQDDYKTAGDIIIAHEEKHLQCRHWIDLLAAEAASVLLWYNPAGWLMRNELQSIHEYEADEAVLNSGIDAHTYQLLLIKKAVGARFPSIANSLNHSNLKKRITMMLRKKSNRKSQWRALAALPALGLAALLLSTPVVADGLQSISTAEITKKNANDDRQQHNNVMNITLSADSAGDTQNSSKNAYVSYIYTSQTDSISLQRNIAFDASDTAKVQIFVNGKPVSEEEFKKISPDDIKNVNVNKFDNGRGVISVILKGCDTVIDDVVVVGFKDNEIPDTKGKVISIRHTSAADSVSAPVLEVKSGDMKNITISNITTPLAAADPVYVVDGKKVENISDIKVEDIESVTVFKDSTEIVKQYDALGKGLIFISLKKK